MTIRATSFSLGLSLLLLSGVTVAAPSPAGNGKRPVIAVFEIATRNFTLPKASLEALTTFLSARIAATGFYRVSPQDAVRKKLKEQKKESYKLCYDRSCQIEIGRELAADRSLATEIAKVGKSCLLSLKLYDLKDEATEFAHAEPLTCDEGAVGATLVRAVKALERWHEKAAQPAESSSGPAAGAPKGPRVSVYVNAKPWAEVLVDDLRRGRTPIRLDLDPRKRFRLSLVREGYETHQQEISPRETRRLQVRMKPTKRGRLDLATSSEWFAIELGPAFIRGSSKMLLGFSFSLGRIKWSRLFWTIFELDAALTPTSEEASTTNTHKASLFAVGSRLGYPWYLGARGQHQLLFGLGVGYLGFDGGSTAAAGGGDSSPTPYFGLSPSVGYLYNAASGFVPVGLWVRGLFALGGKPETGEERPFGVMITASIGLNFFPLIKNATALAERQAKEAEGAGQ